MYGHAIDVVETTPALVIDWAIVRRNVERMAKLCNESGVALRPHIKTHKLIPLAQLQLASGAKGITVSKLGEANVMAAAGIRDILIAYPIVGNNRVDRLLDLATRSTTTVAVDSKEGAEGIAQRAHKRAMTIPLLVEVDTGLHRCGVASGHDAVDLAKRIVDMPGAMFAGLMTHEGHAYAAQDVAGVQLMTEAAARKITTIASQLEDVGIPATTVSMGSSATARFGIGLSGVNEFRPGTYVFNDRTQVALGAAAFADCAAVVIATVVSRAVPGQAVVDAGSKVLTFDRMIVSTAPLSFGVVAEDMGCEVVRLSEEHGILQGGCAASLRVGQRVAIVPNHICPVVNLFQSVHVLTEEGTLEAWPVDARGST
ncbi:MAG: alanine racemase [Acidimicrobiales bacterium]